MSNLLKRAAAAMSGEQPRTTTLSVNMIRRDGGTQPRQGMNEDAVTDYVAALAEGAAFPPVDVMFDGSVYWLFDGFHRVEAHLRSDRVIIMANIYNGTLEDAQWRSYAANQTHGLRRSTADKERAIRQALKHPKAPGLSDRELGRHLGVDNKTIAKYRGEMESTAEIPQSATRTGADGRSINTANIGKRPTLPVEPQRPPAPVPLTLDETKAVIWKVLREQGPAGNANTTANECWRWLGGHNEPSDYIRAAGPNRSIDAEVFADALSDVSDELEDVFDVEGMPAQPAPKPQPQPEADEAPRDLRIKFALAAFQTALEKLDDYGNLTGHFPDVPQARRVLEKMVGHLKENLTT